MGLRSLSCGKISPDSNDKDQLNEKYQLIDSFSGSPEETELENEIITLIKTDNGIQ